MSPFPSPAPLPRVSACNSVIKILCYRTQFVSGIDALPSCEPIIKTRCDCLETAANMNFPLDSVQDLPDDAKMALAGALEQMQVRDRLVSLAHRRLHARVERPKLHALAA